MLTRRLFTKILAFTPIFKATAGDSVRVAAPSVLAAGRADQTAATAPSQVGLPSGVTAVCGTWKTSDGLFQQLEPKDTSLLLLKHIPWNQPYTAKVGVCLSAADGKREAGLALHYRDRMNFVVFSLAQKKGGPYAVLYYEVSPGYRMVADQARLKINLAEWHELTIDVFGHHLYAYLDGSPLVSYSFIGVCPPAHTHDGILWPDDPTHGQVGLFTLNAKAEFRSFEISRKPRYDNIITPQLGRHDPEGHLLPRQSYGETMRQFTEWMIDCDTLVDKSPALPALQHLPPYLLSNWVDSDSGINLRDNIEEFAINHSMLISGAVRYYTFSGNTRALDLASQVADWHLNNLTPAGFALPNLPPSTVNWQPDGSWKGQDWGLEPDKSAFMGISLLKLSAATNEDKYKSAALQIASILRHLQRPDGGWPFRVDPKTGEVKFGYSESALWYAKFYNKVAELTGSAEDRSIARRSLQWLLTNPVKTNNWSSLYGDVPTGMKSYDQWVPLETGMYLLDHSAEYPDGVTTAKEILGWINRTEIMDPGLHQGLPGIMEQTAYRVVLTHHVLRLATFYAKLWQATGDRGCRDLAVQLANSVTWCLMSDGKMRLGLGRNGSRIPLVLVFNDQFADLMAAIPETAPTGENHILQSSSDVRRVAYHAGEISYSTMGQAEDTLCVASEPASITSGGKLLVRLPTLENAPGGWTFDPASRLLRIRHPLPDIVISL
jgi:hypothetical protein